MPVWGHASTWVLQLVVVLGCLCLWVAPQPPTAAAAAQGEVCTCGQGVVLSGAQCGAAGVALVVERTCLGCGAQQQAEELGVGSCPDGPEGRGEVQQQACPAAKVHHVDLRMS